MHTGYAEHFEPNPNFWLIVVYLVVLWIFVTIFELLAASAFRLPVQLECMAHAYRSHPFGPKSHTLEHTKRLLGLRPRFWGHCGPTVSSVSGLWVTFFVGILWAGPIGSRGWHTHRLVYWLPGWLVESSTHNKIMQILGSAAYDFHSSSCRHTHTRTYILRPTHLVSFRRML